MNASNLWHGVYALVIQCVVAFALYVAHVMGFDPTPMAWCVAAGACAGVFFFLGREHAMQEKKLGGPFITHWWEGFTGWGRDQYGDVLGPVVGCAILAIIVWRIYG